MSEGARLALLMHYRRFTGSELLSFLFFSFFFFSLIAINNMVKMYWYRYLLQCHKG